jgi:hypothetical protein
VARFDRVIPPGGTGSIILSVDTERILGEFEKKATIWSNDPEKKSVVVKLIGEVRPYISLEPGGYVSLGGEDQGKGAPGYVDIINNSGKPMEVKSIQPADDLKDRIKYHVETVKAGFSYRLEVKNVAKEGRGYTGHLVIRTNLLEKPELTVIVSYHVKPK